MKNWYASFVVVMLLLIIGGGLTVLANSGDSTNRFEIPFVLRQTDNPEGSRIDYVPWQAEQFFLAIGFVLFNLVGIALTLMAIVWFLNQQVQKAKTEGTGGTAVERARE